MNYAELLPQLEEIAFRLGLSLRYESLHDDDVTIRSGLCYVNNAPNIIVDSRLTPEGKCAVLASVLRGYDLESIHMPPFVRDWIESHRHSPDSGGKQ